MKHYDTKGDKFIISIFYVVLSIILLVVLLPIIHIIACSFSGANDIIEGKVTIFPSSFTITSYKAILQHWDLNRGFLNSTFYSMLGSIIAVSMTIALAYPLSRPELPGTKFISKVMLFTMIFSGGLIPTYLVSKSIGLTNNRIGFLFLPAALSVYNVIVARTFFKSSIDQSIYDSAEVDGAGSLRCLFSIVLPLSKALLAVLLLWEIVSYWNDYQRPLVYLAKRELQPLQIVIREILMMNQVDATMIQDVRDYQEMRNLQITLKYASIVVSSLPLMILYPFIQKHFVKGVMLGSFKG